MAPHHGFNASDEQSGPRRSLPNGVDRRDGRAVVSLRTVALGAGLLTGLALIAASARPGVWLPPPDSVATQANWSGLAAVPPAGVWTALNVTRRRAPESADALNRRQEHFENSRELRLRRERYVQLLRRTRRLESTRRPGQQSDPLLQYEDWDTMRFIDGMAASFNPSDLDSANLADAITGPVGIFGDPATFSDAIHGAAGNGIPLLGKDVVALSGGSTTETSRVSLNAGSTLHMLVAPNWSFIAKFDGEFTPQPQLYGGSGTLQYTW